MKSWRQIAGEVIADRALRIRTLATLVAAALALTVGFLVPTAAQAEQLLRSAGYYLMGAAFVGFGWAMSHYGPRVAMLLREASRWRERWLVGAVLAFALGLMLVAEPAGYKVVNDEFVLQATAMNIHLEREPVPLVRAYEIDGVFTPLAAYADKRPFAFAFLLSLVHDITGYRTTNAFYLNHALGALSLVLVFVLGRQLSGSTPLALTGMMLWAGLPLFVQNANGSGMELMNVTLLALALLLAGDYLERPDEGRAAGLIFTSVILAQTRYESALFIATAVVVLLAGWWRAGRPVLPWAAALAPLLLLPYAWQHAITSANKALWELQPDQESRFALEYAAKNVRAAFDFYFAWGNRMIANSWLLSAGGVVAAGVVLLHRPTLRRIVRFEPETSVAIYAPVVGVNLGVLMFYYWGGLSDPVVARLSLPSLLMATLAVCWALGRVPAGAAPHWALAGVLIYTVGWMRPLMANRYYTELNLAVQQLEWEKGVLRGQPPKPRLVVSNKTTLPWIIDYQPAVIIGHSRARREELRFHLAAKTFEVIVTQRLQPSSPDGAYLIDPADVLPTDFRLEPIAEKRFGATLARISRLVAVGGEGTVERSGQ